MQRRVDDGRDVGGVGVLGRDILGREGRKSRREHERKVDRAHRSYVGAGFV
jgi:hypothetical protein